MLALGASALFLLGSSFQLTVEMFDYLECELNLFQTGESLPPIWPRLPWALPHSQPSSLLGPARLVCLSLQAAQHKVRNMETQALRPWCREGLKLWGICRVGDFMSEQNDHTPQLTGFTPEVQASKSPKTGLTPLTAHGLWPQHWPVLGQPRRLRSQAGTRARFLSEGLLSAVWSVARLSWVVTEVHVRSPNPLVGEHWGLPPAESPGASRLSAPDKT